MTINATVFDVSRDTYTKDGVTRDNNVHLLTEDGHSGQKLKQFLEYPRPVTEKPLEIGTKVSVTILEISGLFGGRVRFRGPVVVIGEKKG